MDDVHILEKFFLTFPGVGKRQARRFAYHVIDLNPQETERFIEALRNTSENVIQCGHCYRFLANAHGDTAHTLCDICRDTLTDETTMLIVAKDVDLENIRRAGVYKGRYFVLGGNIPLSTKAELDRVRMKELFLEVKRAIQEDKLNEIILGLSLNPEGEHTAMYIRSKLSELVEATGATISTLGRGLSTGSELEYMDTDTLENALKTRFKS